MNQENERKTVKKIVWGVGPLGLVQPTAPYEVEVPIHEAVKPKPENDDLKTKIIDIFTGTDRAIPVVLDTLDEAHKEGKVEITDREIQRRINSHPGSLLISEMGIRRALTKLTSKGMIDYRRLTAEQAVEQNSNYGDNFRKAEEAKS